jgi:hypothetical protein
MLLYGTFLLLQVVDNEEENEEIEDIDKEVSKKARPTSKPSSLVASEPEPPNSTPDFSAPAQNSGAPPSASSNATDFSSSSQSVTQCDAPADEDLEKKRVAALNEEFKNATSMGSKLMKVPSC